MKSSTTLTLVDGVRIVVPDSLNLITPYVLVEQLDWFEDEIKFLRRLLQPGQKVIDIGANYGVYTLSMAKTVGPTGSVWAFEPASSTAEFLAQGIASNEFTQVVLERCALSSSCGTSQLSLNEQSEMNALVRTAQSPSNSEIVSLVTLDECKQRYAWTDIAFMKIDAEGEESNILAGGRRFLAELSPLIQYEIKAGIELHMELVKEFAAIGYDSYRLVPGLNLLVPFDVTTTPDGYLLNLFSCKRDRADLLAGQGFLIQSGSRSLAITPSRANDVSRLNTERNKYSWPYTIAKLPYGVHLYDHWGNSIDRGDKTQIVEALSDYVMSLDLTLSSISRFEALERSFKLLKVLCEGQPVSLRLASLARVAKDFGARSVAVSALSQLGDHILKGNPVDFGEPFLVPSERFDSISSVGHGINWILASVLEELEKLGSFSSFYTGNTAMQRLETIRDLGLGSAEMKRRLGLLQQRFEFTPV
jgi:FkbM family methyltransferase